MVSGTPASPRVSVSHVQAQGGARQGRDLRAEITVPRSGEASASWALRVQGSLHVGDAPVSRIEAVTPGQILTAVSPSPVQANGVQEFSILVSTLDLPLDFEFRLRATLPDGGRAKFAAIRGQRAPLRGEGSPRLQPLLVTSLGRMGTTLLMRLLAAHPAVVTYERPPYEARGGKYWTHVLKVMSAPADATKRIGAPMEFHSEPLAVGANPFFSSEFAAWPEVETWSGGDYLAELATFCQRSIDGWYLATAAAQAKDPVPLRYFAEKHFPDSYPRRLRELYTAPAELFLVRDFRDMFASMRAYNLRKGYGDFGRAAAADDRAWIATLRQGLQALLDAWRERGTPATLVRYEDLVRQPEAALPPLLATLGLAASPEAIARMLSAAVPDAPDLRGHGTTASPDASIGRWQADLPPELQQVVNAEFGELLTAFGYARA
ncbi:MAG: sulfotransferase [Thermomicrobiales bacterium]|nr:sulfotransferase [Thermomicrobiales bacterium]